uniref:ZP domain-containing protein n=1 Tax=Leptobrachium leishanense TaxID=445787 RepID=A0A8C5N360_9ANUR
MTLFIEKSSTNGLYDNHLRLNDPQCLLSSNSTHHIASVGFNSCGTEIEETEDRIVFKNQITSFDNINDVITRKHQVIINFNCSFPKKERLSISFQPKKNIYEFTEAGFGKFTYKFRFFTDNRFVQTRSSLVFLLREMIYMEIQVTSSVPNVQLFVDSCRATPRDNPSDPVFYNIVKYGCSRDDTLVIYEGNRTISRFGLEAFTFIGNYEQVYISCAVMLCKLGDPSTRCSRGCINQPFGGTTANRRRRSIISEATESLQHFISQGPLRLKRQSLNEGADGKAALNVNSLLMSLSGVVIVAIIGLTVFFSMKKAQMTKYERLSSEEL